jgi:hypothetical protein
MWAGYDTEHFPCRENFVQRACYFLVAVAIPVASPTRARQPGDEEVVPTADVDAQSAFSGDAR